MMIGDVPRFVGRDVAVALGYSNPRKTLGAHVDDEDKNKNTVTIRDGIQGEPQHDYHPINEQIPKGNQKDRDISSLWW